MDEERRRKTILAVDDSADSLALLSSLLKSLYQVKVAISGEAAIDAVSRGGKPDLILLDVVMPGMDGYEVCARLKSDPSTRDIPVIFLTARTNSSDEEKGLKLGAVDYIVKPFSPSIVLARIARAFEDS